MDDNNNNNRENFYKEGCTADQNCDTCGFQIEYEKSGAFQIKKKKSACLMKHKIADLHKQILGCENNDNAKPRVSLSANNEFFATQKFQDLEEDHKCLLEVFFDEDSYEKKSLPILKTMKKVNFVRVETTKELDVMLDKLQKCEEIAVNLEYYSQRSYLGFTWLLQICTEDTYYMINCLKLQKELHILNTIFMEIGILKIFHDGENAVLRLYKDFGIFVTNMFDTAILRKIIMESKVKDLMQKNIGFEPSQMHTHFLIFFKTDLVNSSITSHNKKFLKTMRQSCEKICRKVHHRLDCNKVHFNKFIDDKATNRERYVSMELLKWRDEIAQKEDEPPNFILPDNDILKIAQELLVNRNTRIVSRYYAGHFFYHGETYFNTREVTTEAYKISNRGKNSQQFLTVQNQKPNKSTSNPRNCEDTEKNQKKTNNHIRKTLSLKRVPKF